jgi:hypothetical protein
MPENLTVAELLTASKQAHAEYRRWAGTIDKQGKVAQPYDEPRCVAAVEKALATMEQAHALDPTHTDPAWQSPEGQLREPLTRFYLKFLSA